MVKRYPRRIVLESLIHFIGETFEFREQPLTFGSSLGRIGTMTGPSLVGKTYSLYGEGNNSDTYYALLHTVADQCLTNNTTPEDLLSLVRRVSKNRRRLRRISRAVDSSEESFLLHTLSIEFSSFTTNVAEHLRDLPLAKRWD